MTLDSVIWKKAEQKAKVFLRQVMGDDVFNKFIKNGKIEIKSNGTIYELHDDGRVINKTTKQNYCIVPDRSDYPSYDIIAIKFAWIKFGQKIVEKVANKTSIDSLGRQDNTNGYAAYVDYMESRGWRREQLTIDERYTNLVTTHSLERETTGTVISIRCPAGRNITVMGTNQIPVGADGRSADTIILKIADKNDVEISRYTRICIDKTRYNARIMLVRSFYYDFSLTRRVNDNGIKIYKTYEEWYRWRAGIHLMGEDTLRINIVNSPVDIDRKNIKIAMDMDYWIR